MRILQQILIWFVPSSEHSHTYSDRGSNLYHTFLAKPLETYAPLNNKRRYGNMSTNQSPAERSVSCANKDIKNVYVAGTISLDNLDAINTPIVEDAIHRLRNKSPGFRFLCQAFKASEDGGRFVIENAGFVVLKR